MTIVPISSDLVNETGSLSLALYANIIGINECGMWGVNDGAPQGCATIWSLAQRKMVARYLAEAQHEIENLIGYKLGIQWVSEPMQNYKCPANTAWGYVVDAGVKATSVISSGEAVSYIGGDPAVIGPIATTVTDVDEIVVYHPGTTIPINPSSVVIAGGNVTIEIPFCRLVAQAFANNPDGGWNIADVATWGEATVDVVRVYNDPSTAVVLISNHACNVACASQGCTGYATNACMYVTDPISGAFATFPATYSNGTWRRISIGAGCCYDYQSMQLNYRDGVELNDVSEDAIIRLAHSKMPVTPCGCDPAKMYWTRDRNIPETLTADRINNPFGLSDGAWIAYKFALSIALTRGSILA